MSTIESTVYRDLSVSRIRDRVYRLADDPLPCRTLNTFRPGVNRSTLEEADDIIRGVLESWGYDVAEQRVPVQCFRPDRSVPHGFQKPAPGDPWFEAVNISVTSPGTQPDAGSIVLIAHKDSQSWLEGGPGAYDNAVGTAVLLELARLLSRRETRRTVRMIFCNEEHWPWTSIQAAERLKQSGESIKALINIDSLAGQGERERKAGRTPFVVRTSTEEGGWLVDAFRVVNERYGLGLEVRGCRTDPNDDDGSFVRAGFLSSVLCIGSMPYADPAYHTVHDHPDRVDYELVCQSARLIAAMVLTLDC